MAITITKTKPKAATATKPAAVKELSDFAELIDNVGKLQADIAKQDEKIAEKAKSEVEKRAVLAKKLSPLLTDLVEALNTVHDDDSADAVFAELGAKYVADVGKKGNQRKLKEEVELADPKKKGEMLKVAGILLLKDLMGEEVFFKCAKVDLKQIDNYLTPEEKELVLDATRTKRPVSVSKRT